MRKRRSGGRSKDEMEREGEIKKNKKFYSTGEIRDLLKGIVSRSTVSRLFDRGKLGGRVNPITGRREIEWQTVMDWLKERGVSPDNLMIEKRLGEEWTGLKKTDLQGGGHLGRS